MYYFVSFYYYYTSLYSREALKFLGRRELLRLESTVCSVRMREGYSTLEIITLPSSSVRVYSEWLGISGGCGLQVMMIMMLIVMMMFNDDE